MTGPVSEALRQRRLEGAAGTSHAPVEQALAEDGVDELLTVVVPRWAHTEPLINASACATVTASDTGRGWTVQLARGTVTVTPGHDEAADAHLAGDTTPQLLRPWGRPAQATLDGDAAAEDLLRGR